jgi:hypothetical protein
MAGIEAPWSAMGTSPEREGEGEEGEGGATRGGMGGWGC